MKNIISLNGAWQLAGIEQGRGNWALPDSLLPSGSIVTDGYVPGEVHVDLHRADLIPDPYFAMNAEEMQWVEEKEWWYKQTFEVDEDFKQNRIYLEFDGLDTCATIFLNGREIGKTQNMFIPHRFDVSDSINIGRNTVAVKFNPPGSSNDIRKMQSSFGLGETPQLIGAGIWRDARLVSYDTVSIADVRVDAEIEGSYANAWITVEMENYTNEDQEVLASVVLSLGDLREKIEVVDTVTPFGGIMEAVIRIEEPELWWPNGFGEPTLYNCMVGIQVEGEVQDVSERKFGVRSVKYIGNDSGSNIPTLIINGEEVFCKGADWVPADQFVSNMTSDRCRELVKLAKNANINTLRVWGGGVYERPEFYDACDEMGIMVRQDFMFNGTAYPETDEFVKEAANETSAIVKQLRTHPCIIAWTGSSNCESDKDNKLFSEVIPNVLRSLDHSRPYFQCSPNSDRIRITGSPSVETLREFIPKDKLFPPVNDVWQYHNKSNQQELVDLTRKMMGDFDTVEQFAAFSGILQGEQLRAEIERCRREKWAIAEAMLWKYNDTWPSVSSSVVDYFLRPKIAYYYAKRAFAPVIVSFKQVEDRVQVYVTSDQRLTNINGMLHIGILTFDTCGFDTQEVPVKLAANTSQAFWESDPTDKLLVDPSRQCLVALLTSKGKTIAESVYFACPFAEIDFPRPKLLIHREQLDENTHLMILSANGYARNVAINGLPPMARPSDDYFDLLPGEMHEITIENINADQAKGLTINVWRR